jgi:glycosyltransferase involved in cell wall biosynthesis
VLRQSLLALWLKWRFKMKYAVSEQNGWYMPGDRRFFRQNFLFRWFVKKIFNNAAALHVVSNSLGIELKKAGLFTRPYSVIPNVVNTNVFKQASDVNHKDAIGFVAITGDTRHKNTDGIIRSFTAFLKKGYKATLHIVGPNIEDLKQLVQINGVEDNVVFYGAVSNEKVASITQLSDAMIFFTRYETFGCVMAEAMCCGLPVIASRLPVLEENLKEGVDALFVESEDEKGLTEKLIEFAQNRQQFNNDLIAANAKDKYNYHRAALQFMELYQKVLAKED